MISELAYTEQETTISARWVRPMLQICVCLCAILVFRYVICDTYLNWDDYTLLRDNPRMLQPTVANLARFWTEYKTGYMALYTPMAYSGWWALARVFGTTHAWPFHVANLLLHTINTALVFALLDRLLRTRFEVTRAAAGAAMGSLLFAVHPMQTEPVCWISGFNNLIAATFSLYALMRFVDFLQATTALRRWGYFLAATTGLLLALFSKPTGLVTPLIAGVLGLVLFWPKRRLVILALLPWMALLVPFILIGQRVQDASSFTYYPWAYRPLIVADTLSFYLGKVLVPYHIVADYSRTPALVLETWRTKPLWPLVLLAVLGAGYVFRRFRWAAAALGVSAAGVACTSGIVSFFFQTYSTIADRYFYLAMLGPSLLLGAIVAAWPMRRVLYSAATALLLLAVMTLHQSINWTSTYYWSEQAMKANPRSVIATMCMGATLARDGYYDMAKPYLDRGVQLAPDNPRVLHTVAMYSLDTKDTCTAVANLMLLLRISPSYDQAYSLMTIAAIRNGTPQLGIAALTEVVTRRPGHADAHAQLAVLHAVMKQYDQALQLFTRALELDPSCEAALAGMAKLETELRGQTVRGGTSK